MGLTWDVAVRWTDDEDATLARLVGEGKTAAAIAKVMGRGRNSVISRVHRTKQNFTGGHPGGGPRGKPEPATKQYHLHAGNIARKKASRAFDPGLSAKLVGLTGSVTGCVSLMELRAGQCKWPVAGERADTLFCAHPVMELGRPYCARHNALAYAAPVARRVAA